MNYLELKADKKDYPNVIEIIDDAEALSAYETLKAAMISGDFVEVEIAGSKTCLRGTSILGVALKPSKSVEDERKRIEELQRSFQAQTSNQCVQGATYGLMASPNIQLL